MSLLEIAGLTVTFNGADGQARATHDVHLHVERGETLAVVGESGSGKTVTALSVLGLTPRPPTCRTEGSIRLHGKELLGLDRDGWRAVRGRRIAMVFQDPSSALNPLLTIGTQITDAVRAHERLNAAAARDRAVEALELAQLPDAPRRLRQYPHELSGGMRQRAAIALALAARPEVLIADEPTTALDAGVQTAILTMLADLRTRLGMALILITHDLGVVAEHADRVAVMYAGRVVESGPARPVLTGPRMPYTRALLDATPRVDAPARQRLAAISGQPPDLRSRPDGCPFAARCPMVADDCRRTHPPIVPVGPGHLAACLRAGERGADGVLTVEIAGNRAEPQPPAAQPLLVASAESTPLAEFDAVTLSYPVRSGPLRRVVDHVHAVRDVSLRVRHGETLALVGESGSGKTSLTRMLLRLQRPTGGAVRYGGFDVTKASGDRLRSLQRDVQVVFQNPYASLDPRMTVADILAEPLRVHDLPSGAGVLSELLHDVGLDAEALHRFPAAFSGGQRQRIAIARAIAVRPRLIVCDEAVSALDVSIQAQVLNLLSDLQRRTGVAYLFITHDLAVVRSIAHRIAVMRAGRIVEEGPAELVYDRPSHEYTRSLLAMAPGHPLHEERNGTWSASPASA